MAFLLGSTQSHEHGTQIAGHPISHLAVPITLGIVLIFIGLVEGVRRLRNREEK